MVIGVDLEKDERVLYDAYNDKAGVTARFNLNVLRADQPRTRRQFRSIGAFTHRAIYNRERHRIEMHLISQKAQTVRVLGTSFSFRAGESIHTENSYKYSLERFAALARGAGWTSARHMDGRRGNVLGSRAGGVRLRLLGERLFGSDLAAPDPNEIDSHTATTIMIADVASDSISGDRPPANQTSTSERDDADAVRELEKAPDSMLEQDGADQEQQGSADRAQHRPGIGMLRRVGQHEIVGDRRQNDAGHDRHVQIGIGEPRQPPRFAGPSKSARSRLRRPCGNRSTTSRSRR